MAIVLITGAGRKGSLGFEVGKQLAEAGDKVILTARRMAQVTPLAKELSDRGLQAVATPLDISDGQSVKAVATFVQSHYGKLDVLINNATLFGEMKTVENTDIDELTNQFNTNVIGTYRVTKAMIPLLKKSVHGRIVNVTSGAGSFSDPVYGLQAGQPSDYGITKLATNGLTVKLAHELKGNHILVNSVCPDVTATRWSMGRPVSQSAKSITWAADLPDDGPTGGFFRDGKRLPW